MKFEKPQPCRPLVEVLQGIEDQRQRRGLRYPLSALLSLCCAGILCGCRSYSAIAQWGRECDRELATALGFSVVTTAGIERRPGASTLFYVLRDIDRQSLERQLGQWMEEVLSASALAPGELEAVAIDGKTLRGSAKAIKSQRDQSDQRDQRDQSDQSDQSDQRDKPADSISPKDGREDVPGVHLLSALSHRLGITLGQVAVGDKANEITAAPDLLRELMLKGRVVTLDAMFTQRSIAEAIVLKKGTT